MAKKIFWGSNFMGSTTFWGSKILWGQNFVWVKTFGVSTFLRGQQKLGGKNVLRKFFWGLGSAQFGGQQMFTPPPRNMRLKISAGVNGG